MEDDKKGAFNMISEFIMNNIVVFVFVILGGFSPGLIIIYLFRPEWIVQFDIIKLLILSYAICAPLVLSQLLAIVLIDNLLFSVEIFSEGRGKLVFALNMVNLALGSAVMNKIADRSGNLNTFVDNVIRSMVIINIPYIAGSLVAKAKRQKM